MLLEMVWEITVLHLWVWVHIIFLTLMKLCQCNEWMNVRQVHGICINYNCRMYSCTLEVYWDESPSKHYAWTVFTLTLQCCHSHKYLSVCPSPSPSLSASNVQNRRHVSLVTVDVLTSSSLQVDFWLWKSQRPLEAKSDQYGLCFGQALHGPPSVLDKERSVSRWKIQLPKYRRCVTHSFRSPQH